MKISDASQSPEYFASALHSNSPPDFTPQVQHDPNFHHRLLQKSPSARSFTRRLRDEFPATPLRGWKFQERNDITRVLAAGRRYSRRVRGGEQISVSARKLAAGLWQLSAEVAIPGGGGSSQCDSTSLHCRFPNFHSKEQQSGTKDTQTYQQVLTNRLFSDVQTLKLQEFAIVPVVSVLQAELKWAQARIKELKAEHQFCTKEVLLFLRKLGEEKTSWMRREHQKLHAIIYNIKHELKRERQRRQRVQIVNFKLLKDIAGAKFAANNIMQNYEKERKVRELIEEVCHELAKKIEDKIEMEELKRNSFKICEQVEEERKIMQMAEVWREERVKKKLEDAKLILEEKLCQMNNLIADLEVFLKSRDESLEMIEISEAEVIREAVKSVDIRAMEGILCSTIVDLQNDVARNRENVQSVNNSFVSYGSEIMNNPAWKPFNGYADDGGVLECSGYMETVTHNEDQGSSYTPDANNCTNDRKSVERIILKAMGASRIGPSCLTGHDSLKSEISDMCSALAKQLKKKPSTASKQPNSSQSDTNANKIISFEGIGRRCANGLTSKMGKLTLAGTLVEDVVCHDMAKKRNSHDLGNPHITRGMKGCIEWPQEIPKNSMKAKLSNTRYKGKRSENLAV